MLDLSYEEEEALKRVAKVFRKSELTYRQKNRVLTEAQEALYYQMINSR